MSLRRAAAFVFVWYFLMNWNTGNSSFTQVGPFATQAACERYQTIVSAQLASSGSVMPCFSTTAK
jgi:hypothetical protein